MLTATLSSFGGVEEGIVEKSRKRCRYGGREIGSRLLLDDLKSRRSMQTFNDGGVSRCVRVSAE